VKKQKSSKLSSPKKSTEKKAFTDDRKKLRDERIEQLKQEVAQEKQKIL